MRASRGPGLGTKRNPPPPALAGRRVEYYALRDRSLKYSGHSSLYRDGKEVGPVPALAICRDENGEVLLLHCDRRWDVLGIAAYKSVLAAKQKAERIYPGISTAWLKTDTTKREVRRYLESIGHYLSCSFCGKSWADVKQMVSNKDETVSVCDGCVAELSELVRADNEQMSGGEP